MAVSLEIVTQQEESMNIDLSLEDIKNRFCVLDMTNASRLAELMTQSQVDEIGSGSIEDPDQLLDELHGRLLEVFGVIHRANPLNVIGRAIEEYRAIMDATQDIYFGGIRRFTTGEVKQVKPVQSMAMIAVVSPMISAAARKKFDEVCEVFARTLTHAIEHEKTGNWK